METSRFISTLEEKKVLVSDGATGTNLIQRGLPKGMPAENWVLENPEEITRLHQDFIKAGADIILTCTFGGSKIRLEQSNLSGQFKEINTKAAKLARKAAEDAGVLVAGSIGPLGHMLKPLGLLEESEAEKNYRDQAAILSDAGVDILLIETQFDLVEATAAVQGARNASDLPIICSFSFDRGTKTMMGVSPTKFAEALEGSGISMIGINCGKGLEENYACLQELSSATSLPIWFKPNAGLPIINQSGETEYSIFPEEMAENVHLWLKAGAEIIGGCCGTSPDHLRQISKAVKKHR